MRGGGQQEENFLLRVSGGIFFFSKWKDKDILRKRNKPCLQRKMAGNKNLNLSWFEQNNFL